jgi:hypothetical protein
MKKFTIRWLVPFLCAGAAYILFRHGVIGFYGTFFGGAVTMLLIDVIEGRTP